MIKQVGPDAAIAELPRKLRHENAMRRKLKSFFNNVAEDLRADIELYRLPSSFPSHNAKMDELISKTYKASSKTFKSGIRKELNLGKINDLQINTEIDNFIAKSSQRQSLLIMKTTRKQAENITKRIVEQSAREEVTLTNKELASKVVKDFKKVNRPRIKTISQTEVQNISEQSKFTEARVLEKNNAGAN